MLNLKKCLFFSSFIYYMVPRHLGETTLKSQNHKITLCGLLSAYIIIKGI